MSLTEWKILEKKAPELKSFDNKHLPLTTNRSGRNVSDTSSAFPVGEW